MRSLPEHRESLWRLTVAPAIWAAHFVLCYATASIWCAKVAGPDGPLGAVRLAVGVYTVLALGGIGVVALTGHRRHSYGHSARPHDVDTPEDRHRFLGFATLLLSGLSAVAAVWVGLAAVFIGSCR